MTDQTDLGLLLLNKIVLDLSDLKKGLREGREDMQSFKSMAQGVGESVKKAFAFAGIAVGIYEVVTALRDFAKDAATVGARTETLEIAMNKVGQTYGVSRASLKYYVNELKAAGITTQESMQAVTKFLTSGLPLDQIKSLATRARDIAVVAGVNTSEALNRIVQGIITGEQETLRRMMIQVGSTDEIYKRYAASLGKTKEQLNSVEKAQAMLNEVMRLSAGFTGVAAEADASVGKQMASMARFAEEAKNSLWALFGPIMLEVVQQTTQGWKQLKSWADANEDSLKAWGVGIAEFIQRKIELIAQIGKAINRSRELILAVAEMTIFKTAAGWLVTLGTGAVGAAASMKTLAGGIGLVNLAMGGWLGTLIKLIGALAAYGAYQTIKKPTALGEMSPEEAQLLGEAWVLKGPTAAKPEPTPGSEGFGSEGIESKSEIEARAKKEAADALKKAKQNAPPAIDKGSKSGKETTDNLLTPMLSMLKVKREAELQDAQNSLDLLKSTNEKKRVELERALAAQEIDGRTYYLRLQELQQQETTAALAMIAQKKRAQEKAYQDALAETEADEKLSPAAQEIARQKLAAENKKTLAKLDTEAAQARMDGEKRVTDELKRQLEARQQSVQKTEDLNLETSQLLGQITDQEAKLQRLVYEWQRAKQEAIKRGATPEEMAALDANLAAKQFDVKYGSTLNSISSEFSSGISNIINGIRKGTVDIGNTLIEMFNSIMMSVLKPGFDALGNALTSAIKWLLNSLSSSLGGGNLFGEPAPAMAGGDYSYLSDMVGALRVPGFAEGVIATRPTLAVIAEAGEAELVSPLSKLPELLGRGPTQVNIINKNLPEMQGSAQQNDDGSLDVFLERKTLHHISNGPAHQYLRTLMNKG